MVPAAWRSHFLPTCVDANADHDTLLVAMAPLLRGRFAMTASGKRPASQDDAGVYSNAASWRCMKPWRGSSCQGRPEMICCSSENVGNRPAMLVSASWMLRMPARRAFHPWRAPRWHWKAVDDEDVRGCRRPGRPDSPVHCFRSGMGQKRLFALPSVSFRLTDVRQSPRTTRRNLWAEVLVDSKVWRPARNPSRAKGREDRSVASVVIQVLKQIQCLIGAFVLRNV
jgi:hypothetical protein